jgi:hypothetical protein
MTDLVAFEKIEEAGVGSTSKTVSFPSNPFPLTIIPLNLEARRPDIWIVSHDLLVLHRPIHPSSTLGAIEYNHV